MQSPVGLLKTLLLLFPELVGAVAYFSPSIHGPYESQVKHGDFEGYRGTVTRIPLCE